MSVTVIIFLTESILAGLYVKALWYFFCRGRLPLHNPRVHPAVSGRGERRRRALREADEAKVQAARPQQHLPRRK